jgi:hypothetical protein
VPNFFKTEFDKLKRKNSYSGIEKDIIDYFFHKTAIELASGTRLNGHSEIPYIKKRLEGKGGFRIYFLLIIKNGCLYLMYIHPKTGTLGRENISREEKAALYKDVLEAIKTANLYKLNLDETQSKLSFDAIKKLA